MTAMQVAQRMTADEFLALPLPPGQKRVPRQLIEGEVVMYEPRWRHNYVQMEILVAVANWTKAAPGRGRVGVPLDVKLDERNVYAPDVLWYPEEAQPDFDAFPSPLPALAVEVRSPSTWRCAVGAKKTAYERNGLPELLGIEGLALLRAGERRRAGSLDACTDEMREIPARIGEAPFSDARELPAREVVEGYATWAESYDEPGNDTIAMEEPAVRALLDELPPPGRCSTPRAARDATRPT